MKVKMLGLRVSPEMHKEFLAWKKKECKKGIYAGEFICNRVVELGWEAYKKERQASDE